MKNENTSTEKDTERRSEASNVERLVRAQEKVETLMIARGFSEYSRSGDGSSVGYIKTVDNVTIYASVDLQKGTCQLEGLPGRFRLLSDEFSLNHDEFERLFELPLISVMQRLEAL